MSTDSGVENKILECIDEGLDALGKSGKQALIHYLERNIDLKREEIPKKPELFCKGLILVLGEQGSKALGKRITRKLLQSFKLEKKMNLTFVEVIERIKAAQKTRGEAETEQLSDADLDPSEC